MLVVKRDGSRETLDLNKFHRMVEEACSGLTGVSSSQIEMNSGIQFYDGISSREIQEILIRSANDLISLENPNYQYVASRLLLFGLRKDVYGQFDPLPLGQIIQKNIQAGVYDPEFTSWYTEEEITALNSYLKYERDLNFTFAGLQQLIDKYFVQDRNSGVIYETPQIMFMMIAATLFRSYPVKTRMFYVKRFYDLISGFKINLPTPIMGGVRTPMRQYASCVLIDVDDSLDSIFASNTVVGKYTAQRAGIGLNIGRIRSIGSRIRGGEVVHTGLLPFIKMLVATTKSTTQNGSRGGSATLHVPIWHPEIQDIIVLKNNKGTEDNRERRADYSIQLSKIFYQRFLNNEIISLFDPGEHKELYELWGSKEFDERYLELEKQKKYRKQVSALELFTTLFKERAETGRIYIQNIDHVNDHSPFNELVKLSNLCQEIALAATPIDDIHDIQGQIATCILSAINIGKVNKISELEEICEFAVRALDALIDHQQYPFKAAELYTKRYRTLGIGYTGLAHYLAKNKLKYGDKEAWQLVHDTTEALQYYLMKASVKLAKEQGPAEKFPDSKMARGILPIDTYKKDADTIIDDPSLKMDWQSLRQDILAYGIRNLTVSCQAPIESSSIYSNSTNGVEPPRELLSVKKSKKGMLKQIVPGYHNLKNYYTLLWEQPNMTGYINICAVIQKFFDQSISANTAYNAEHYPNNEIPMSVIARDLLYGYKMGLKNWYYHNTQDGKKESDQDSEKPLDITDQDTIENTIDQDDCESCKI